MYLPSWKSKKRRSYRMTREELLDIYLGQGITRCELRFPNCTASMFLGIAHRHKRHWYLGREGRLWSWNQTILACNNCHNVIEYNKEKTKEVFRKLRPYGIKKDS